MKLIFVIAIILVSKLYLDYQIETKDKSIQGFLQYLKTKYYDKPNSR